VTDTAFVTLDAVKADSDRYGRIAYLGTVSKSGQPYTSPVAVAWDGDRLLAFVATNEAKVANVRANGRITVHFAVSEATAWDSCVLWGQAQIIDSTAGREQLWDKMGYDLKAFEPGGPSADTHVFIVVRPTKAVILRTYGMKGREEWVLPRR
jgi:nitroimidazol reductase NimA-like FMN-containing flavoprotein (pyridoxamine 5'-phosphate oxidase superfamily)